MLLAGGRNKGLDLTAMAGAPERVRAVVALGEAAPEVEAAFAGVCPVTTVTSMDEAVGAARGVAVAGDAVLLSPGCASFDWYGGYAERGDDFARGPSTDGGPGLKSTCLWPRSSSPPLGSGSSLALPSPAGHTKGDGR